MLHVTIELQQVTHFCVVSGYLYSSSIKPDLLLVLWKQCTTTSTCQTLAGKGMSNKTKDFSGRDMLISSTPVKGHPLSALEVG